MAAGLLRKKTLNKRWRFEVRGEVVREWVEGGRGGGRCICGAVVVLVEGAYRLLEVGLGVGGPLFGSRAGGGGC